METVQFPSIRFPGSFDVLALKSFWEEGISLLPFILIDIGYLLLTVKHL